MAATRARAEPRRARSRPARGQHPDRRARRAAVPVHGAVRARLSVPVVLGLVLPRDRVVALRGRAGRGRAARAARRPAAGRAHPARRLLEERPRFPAPVAPPGEPHRRPRTLPPQAAHDRADAAARARAGGGARRRGRARTAFSPRLSPTSSATTATWRRCAIPTRTVSSRSSRSSRAGWTSAPSTTTPSASRSRHPERSSSAHASRSSGTSWRTTTSRRSSGASATTRRTSSSTPSTARACERSRGWRPGPGARRRRAGRRGRPTA